MSVAASTQSILGAITEYQNFLTEVSEDEFQLAPAEKVWSYSEVFSHIIQANLRSLLAVQKCIYGKPGKSVNLPLTSRVILFFGRFPPVKIKAPESIAALVRKMTKEEARNDLIRLRTKVMELGPKVSKSFRDCRMQHPRLGMLNAVEWWRFVEIHSHHHLKQLKRIKKMLAKQSLTAN
jgi:hypothetical protein